MSPCTAPRPLCMPARRHHPLCMPARGDTTRCACPLFGLRQLTQYVVTKIEGGSGPDEPGNDALASVVTHIKAGQVGSEDGNAPLLPSDFPGHQGVTVRSDPSGNELGIVKNAASGGITCACLAAWRLRACLAVWHLRACSVAWRLRACLAAWRLRPLPRAHGALLPGDAPRALPEAASGDASRATPRHACLAFDDAPATAVSRIGSRSSTPSPHRTARFSRRAGSPGLAPRRISLSPPRAPTLRPSTEWPPTRIARTRHDCQRQRGPSARAPETPETEAGGSQHAVAHGMSLTSTPMGSDMDGGGRARRAQRRRLIITVAWVGGGRGGEREGTCERAHSVRVRVGGQRGMCRGRGQDPSLP